MCVDTNGLMFIALMACTVRSDQPGVHSDQEAKPLKSGWEGALEAVLGN